MLNDEATWSVFQVFASITPPTPLKTEGKNAGAATRRIKSFSFKKKKVDFQTLGDYTTLSSFEETNKKNKKGKSFPSVLRSQLSDA